MVCKNIRTTVNSSNFQIFKKYCSKYFIFKMYFAGKEKRTASSIYSQVVANDTLRMDVKILTQGNVQNHVT